MKRLFSGAKSPTFSAPPKLFQRDPSSPKSINSRRLSSTASITNFFSSSTESTPKTPSREVFLPQEASINGAELSPELVPIVTLLSAQTHRRYHKGVFLILQDLKNDGSPADRKWQKMYGLLLGTQLALWDAHEIADNANNISKENLKKLASQPTYINFTDAILRPLNSTDEIITENNQDLTNVLVVSTTLKNRYFIKFTDRGSFDEWHAAIRLSLFECNALQEAYTGAFLSSRGSKLGDIQVILADNKFKYADWVSVRFGAGMPWKHCYAVISQTSNSKKNQYGQISFYESDKKINKKKSMANVTMADSLSAIYPSSPLLIDTSTIIKLEGSISFINNDEAEHASIFIMPEKHQAVPGYDTIIRFLIPAMNAFKLYGRPKALIANRDDPNSLLFALPTLPHVHYLRVIDILPFAKSEESLQWTNIDWKDNIKGLLQDKLSNGYTGCGSNVKLPNMLSSPTITSSELFEDSRELPIGQIQRPIMTGSSSSISTSVALSTDKQGTTSNLLADPFQNDSVSKSAASIAMPKHQRNSSKSNPFLTPTVSVQSPEKELPSLPKGMIEIPDSNFDSLNSSSGRNFSQNSNGQSSDLGVVYDRYTSAPFGNTIVEENQDNIVSQKIYLDEASFFNEDSRKSL